MIDEVAVRIEQERRSRFAHVDGGDFFLDAVEADVGGHDAEKLAVFAHGLAQGHDLDLREVVHVDAGKLHAVMCRGAPVPFARRRVEFGFRHDAFLAVKEVAVGEADEKRIDAFALHEILSDGSKGFVGRHTGRPGLRQSFEDVALRIDEFDDLFGFELGAHHHLALRGFLQQRACVPVAEHGHREEDEAEGNSHAEQELYS